MKKIHFSLLLLLLFWFSCKNKDDINPNIIVDSPSGPLSLTAGDTILISGSASDFGGLSNVYTEVRSKETGAIESSQTEGLTSVEDSFRIEYSNI